MNYVFFDIETIGLDFNKDEIIYISCVKVDKEFNKLEKLEMYVEPNNKIPEYLTKMIKIDLDNVNEKYSLKGALKVLKKFILNCILITYNSKFDLSFLLKSLYNQKLDMSFWYVDLYKLLGNKTLDAICKEYKIEKCGTVYDYIDILKKYVLENNVCNLDVLTSGKPKIWICFFRGINYPEYIVDTKEYGFYMVDFDESKYPSYIACLKEIRCEYFSNEELIELKRKYDIKLLAHILNLNEDIIKITNDYYITSFGSKIDLNKKWGRDYVENLRKAAKFIDTHDEEIRITCYDSVSQLNDRTVSIDKEIMNKVKSKIVMEKKKWTRWSKNECKSN